MMSSNERGREHQEHAELSNILAAAIFGERQILKAPFQDIRREQVRFMVFRVKDAGRPDTYFIEMNCDNEGGLDFRLDENARMLIGDYRAYPISIEAVTLIKQLAVDE